MAPDYYQILGISPEASYEEVRRAFLEKAKAFHPDVYQGPDGDRIFKLVNEAYRTLRNPQRRKQYDFRRRYGTILEFRRTAQQEAEKRREEYRRAYVRRRMEEERHEKRENRKVQRILDLVLVWIMAFILTAGLVFSLIDAWFNFHFSMLVILLSGIGLLILAWFRYFRRRKE